MKLLPSTIRRIPGLGGAGGGGGGPMLGIAVGERAWTIAEVAPSRSQRGSWDLRRVAEFVPPVPAGGTTPDPTAAGQALAQFLRDHSFNARGAVLGIPAKWIIGRDKEIPPSGPEQAAEILRLQAERAFSSDVGDLAYDYAGLADASAPSTVLLLALRRSQLDHVVAIAEAAGRDVVAVTPSTLALSEVAARRSATAPVIGGQAAMVGAADGLVVNVMPDAVELSARAGGNPRLLRHLTVRAADLASKNGTRASAFAALAGEIRRSLATLPGGNTVGGPNARALQLFDGAGLGDSDGLAEQLGLEVKYRPGVSALRVTGPAAAAAGAETRYAPAVALALAGAERKIELVDFLHPRLAPPKESRIGRRELWAILISVSVIVLALLFWMDLRNKEHELKTLTEQHEGLKKSVETFQAVIDRVQAANPWFEQRGPTLECFHELTKVFPDVEVYVTSFTLTEPDSPATPSKVRVNGRGPYESTILQMGDRLRANPKFSNVSVETRAAGGNSREVVFTLTCNYSEHPPTATQRSTAKPTGAANPREVRK